MTAQETMPKISPVRKRRFKDIGFQKVYEVFLADPTTRGDLHNSYKRGRANLTAPHRGSKGYAAWAAGQDHYRMAVAAGHADPNWLPDELFAKFSLTYLAGRQKIRNLK
jgi:hypothetical protein